MNDLTRAELMDLLEEMQDRGGPDFSAVVEELEKRNRMGQRLKIHHAIECENDQKYRAWQQAR